MKAYELSEFGVENLKIVDRDEQDPGDYGVEVKLKAASLNYRDLMVVKGWYNPNMKLPVVPVSDGAGEVTRVGSKVTRWKVGDRVMPIFMQRWIKGEISHDGARSALGGDLDGCLRESGVFDEDSLVRIPRHLSYPEAATLPCAALTAWNALKYSGDVKKGESVLLLGTGGVSIFALQFAKLLGAEVIITSSSDEKLGQADILGADHLVNYKATPDWDEAVRVFCGQRGVDHVIEVGGAGTMQRSLNSVRLGGHVAVIGVLAGKGEFDPVSILMKSLRLQGIYVGSREMFESMNEFISRHYLKPVVDRVFSFSEAPEALTYMEGAGHFGKIVINIDES